jgi:hypothetical protein
MHGRYPLAISLAVLSAALVGNANAQTWSPLSTDVKSEIGSTEPAEELKHFRDLRAEMTAEEIAEREAQKKQKKAKGLLGRFKRDPKPATAEQPATAQEETVEAPAEPVAEAAKPMPEPGTAPAHELSEDAAATADDEDAVTEDEPKKKAAKEVPGSKPTEDTNDAGYFIKRAQAYANSKETRHSNCSPRTGTPGTRKHSFINSPGTTPPPHGGI